jgi:hypothetical protein
MNAAEDLRGLGIDRAELRWLAARDYLGELRRERGALAFQMVVGAAFLDLAERWAEMRGVPAQPIGTRIDQLVVEDLRIAREALMLQMSGASAGLRRRAQAVCALYTPTHLKRVPW